MVVPPCPSHSSSTGEGFTAADHGNSDLSRVDRSNVVASAGQTEDRNGSNPSASSSRLPQVLQGEYRGAPQLGSTLRFSDQWKRFLESCGKNREVLNEQDFAFLMNHIMKGTKGTSNSRWCQFSMFCESQGIDPQWAPVPLKVRYIHNLFESKFSCSVVNMAV